MESNVIVESRDVQFIEYKTRNDSTNESSKSLLGGVDEINTPTNTPNSSSSPLLVDKENVGFLMQLITLISSGRHEKHTRIASYIV